MAMHEARGLLARLDRGLDVARNESVGAFGARAPWLLRPENHERLVRLGLEAMVVADVARSIPSNVTVHGELAERLRAELSVLPACAIGYQHLLETTPAAVRRNVDRAFRQNPDTAMDLAAWLDERAGVLAISHESRLKLRTISTQTGARIRRQSAGAVFADSASKVGTLLTRSGHELAALRASTTGTLVDHIWAQAAAAEVPAPPSDRGPGDSELISAAILLPAAFAVFGITALVEVATSGAIGLATGVAATPAGSLLICGLICLIVGLVQNAEAE